MADAPLVQPQAFTAEGAPIAPEETAAAIAGGKAYFRPGEKVVARTSEGRLVSVPADRAGHPGLSLVSPEELAQLNEARVYGKGLGNQAEAFGAGAARTLSLGLSDVAARGLGGEETAKKLDALRRQNPISTVAGEVAGAGIPLLLSGGGSAAVEGGSALASGAKAAAGAVAAPIKAVGAIGGAVERGVSGLVGSGSSALGRAASKAVSLGASGAVEGAVFGTGQTLSESALSGDPLTAEALAAGMGSGALFGGVLGAGIGAGGELLSSAINKAGPKLKEGLEGAATKFARKQLGRDFENVGKGMPREQAEAWKNADAKTLLERKLAGGENAGKTVFEASKKPADIADNLGQLNRDIGQELGEVRERAASFMDQQPQLAPDPEEMLSRVDDYIAKLRKTKVAGNYSLARAAEREIAPLRASLKAAQEVGVSPGVEAAEAAGAGFDEAATRAGRVAEESGQANHVDDFLNKNRRSVSEAERSGAANDTSSGVNKFLRKAQQEGAVYDGPVYRGTNAEELEQLRRTGRVGHTLSVSQDIEGAGHFAKKGGVLLEIKDHPVPVDGIAGSNTFSEALIPKDSPVRIVGERMEGDMRIITLQMEAPGASVGSSAVANDVTPSMGYREILKWHQDLESSLNPAGVAKSMRGVAIKSFGAKQEVANIANAFLKEKTAQALTAAGEDGSIVQRLHQEYAGTKAMQQAAEKEAKRVASNRHVSLTDHMLGIGAALMHMASGNAGALASMGLGGAWAIGNKIAREQGNAIAAHIAQRASRMTLLVDSAAKSLAGTGERIALPVRAATRLSEEPRPQASSRKELTAEFNRFRDRVQELGNPDHQQAQLSHATSEVQTAYPEVAAALSQQLLRAHSYLASQLPAAPPRSGLFPMKVPVGVEPRAMQSFLSKVRGALDPEGTIEDLASGNINDDAVGALREVYPQTFTQLRQKTIETVAENKHGLPYNRVIHLSGLFGFVGDSSLSPARLPEIQQVIQQISAQPQPNGAGPGAPGKTTKARPSSSRAASVGKSYALPGSKTPGSI